MGELCDSDQRSVNQEKATICCSGAMCHHAYEARKARALVWKLHKIMDYYGTMGTHSVEALVPLTSTVGVSTHVGILVLLKASCTVALTTPQLIFWLDPWL